MLSIFGDYIVHILKYKCADTNTVFMSETLSRSEKRTVTMTSYMPVKNDHILLLMSLAERKDIT